MTKIKKYPITLNWLVANISFGRIKMVATSKKHFYIIEEGLGSLKRDVKLENIEFAEGSILYSLEVDGVCDRAFFDINEARNYCEYLEAKELNND